MSYAPEPISATTMKTLTICHVLGAILFIAGAGSAQPAAKPRARDLGVPFDGTPGQFNAITDVKGVEVGHTTLISGSGKLKVGEGPVRTGVTAVLPRGKDSLDPVFGGWISLSNSTIRIAKNAPDFGAVTFQIPRFLGRT